MPGKSRKPYKSPKRTTKGNKFENTMGFKKKKLDVTTRIRVDEIRLNDSDSLDTSFLEGRYEKRANRNSTKVKEKILKDDSEKIKKLELLKKIFYGIAVVFTLILLVILLVNIIKKIDFSPKTTASDNVKVEKKKKVDTNVIDNNYLFVGDFHTKKFEFSDFDLDYHYVKSSDDYLTTSKVLDDMKKNIYQYNPSIVFIELGLADLDKKKSKDDIINNISEIIDSIKNNRTYASICVESIYPINRDVDDFDDDAIDDSVDNDDIIKINDELKKLAKDKNVTYIDVFSMLEDKKKLNKDYTDDGVHLNKDGYKQVLKLINKEIDK